MASSSSSIDARSSKFRKFLVGLMQGDPIRLDDAYGPPWFEAGVVCEVSEGTYSLFQSSPLWTDGSKFVFGGGSSPLRLFWRNDGKCLGRELTLSETQCFRELWQTSVAGETQSCFDAHERGRIRLACMHCDTEVCDGVDRVPETWDDVDEFQSYEASLREVTPQDTRRSPTEWYTHLGVCPDCRVTHGR